MTIIENRVFEEDQAVTVDDTHFINCRFMKCTLHYAGGEWNMTGCHVAAGIQIEFSGCAMRTAVLMDFIGANPAAREKKFGH